MLFQQTSTVECRSCVVYAQDNNSLPVWSIFVTSLLTHISINSQPFLVGIVSPPWSNDPDEKFFFDPNFDEFGDYTQRAIQTLSVLDDSSSTLTPHPTLMTNQHVFRTNQHDVSPETPDYPNFWPYFGWVNVDTVQKTMEQSTQWGVSIPNTFPMKKHLKSRKPALNIPRRHEPVASDTVFSDTPAVDSGVT